MRLIAFSVPSSAPVCLSRWPRVLPLRSVSLLTEVWKVLGRVADANGRGPGFGSGECNCVRSAQDGFGAEDLDGLRFKEEALDGIAFAQAETFTGL
jgi:hypothetical protein